MGDSDEEYDRRRVRDKFRGERSDYERRPRDYRERRDWGDRRRESWGGGRDNWDARGEGRKRSGQYYGRPGRDSEGGGQVSPPMKRNRRDWDASFGDDYQGFGGGGGGGGGMMPSGGGWGAGGGAGGGPGNIPLMGQPIIDGSQPGQPDMGSTDMPGPKVPRMMTFKEFLNAQEDDIDDVEAVRRFQEYKTEFKRTALSDFFVLHKEEEWFKNKFHPTDSAKRKNEIRQSIRRRLRVFLDLLEAGLMDPVSLDSHHENAITKLLDIVVIKLEGGTEEDIAKLDQLYAEQEAAEQKIQEVEEKVSKETTEAKENELSPSSVPLPDAPPPLPEETGDSKSEQPLQDQELTAEQQQLQQQAQIYQQQRLQMESNQEQTVEETTKSQEKQKNDRKESDRKQKKKGEKGKKREQRRESYQYEEEDDEDSESESDSDSDSSEESEPAPPGEGSDIITTEPDDKEASTDENKESATNAGKAAEKEESETDKNTDEDHDEDIVPPGTEDVSIPSMGAGTDTEKEPVLPGIGAEEEPAVFGMDDGNAPQHATDGMEDSDPAPPGVDEEPYSSVTNEDETNNKDRSDASDDDDEVDERESQWEQRKGSGLGAFLGLLRHESTEEPAKPPAPYPKKADVEDERKEREAKKESESDEKDESGDKQENGSAKELNEEEKQRLKEENWEHRKGSGLGSLMNFLRGDEGAEEKEKDAENEEDDNQQKDEEKEKVKEQQPPPPEVDEAVNKENVEQEHVSERRQLHKTLSLFMRNVPPNISKGDIAAVCKRYPGFLRVALADPSPERRFFRRGWVTFANTVNIKDICWNLSNIRIKDCELNPCVNRDLSKRIRPINGITMSKQVVRFDIKLAANLIKALDEKFLLYVKDEEDSKDENAVDIEEQNGDVKKDTEAEEKKEATENEEANDQSEPKESMVVESPIVLPNENPVLLALPEIATEEEEGEEMELIGLAEKNAENEIDFTKDEKLMKALDRLLLYLRVVHSVDYYNGSDYPYEDEMPNRCGIIHVRGPPLDKASQSEVSDWQKTLEQKLEHFMKVENEQISDEDAEKLGKKVHDTEVENFIKANIQELGKDKWLCPLSGKKFRAAEFVRKHIFNKHADKVEAVKLEVDYFNNYLYDKNRPQFPDPNQIARSPAGASVPHPQIPFGQPPQQQQQQPQQQPMYPQMGWNPQNPMMMYGGPRAPFTPPANYGNFGRGVEMYGRGGGHTYPPKPRWGSSAQHHRDTRKIIQYRDLDAPDDVDFF